MALSKYFTHITLCERDQHTRGPDQQHSIHRWGVSLSLSISATNHISADCTLQQYKLLKQGSNSHVLTLSHLQRASKDLLMKRGFGLNSLSKTAGVQNQTWAEKSSCILTDYFSWLFNKGDVFYACCNRMLGMFGWHHWLWQNTKNLRNTLSEAGMGDLTSHFNYGTSHLIQYQSYFFLSPTIYLSTYLSLCLFL